MKFVKLILLFVFIVIEYFDISAQNNIIAPYYSNNTEFGNAIEATKDYLIAGQWKNDENATNSGCAYLYKISYPNNTLSLEAKLKPSSLSYGDYFGVSVSMSDSFAVVGSFGDDEQANNAGAAYIYKLDTSNQWVFQQKIFADDASSNAFFGKSVKVHNNILVVGAYTESSNYTSDGAAYIFQNINNTWTQIEKLVPDTPVYNAMFGNSVSLNDSLIVIGAPSDMHNGNNCGSITIYQHTSYNHWVLDTTIYSPTSNGNDYFGKVVDISENNMILVSAIGTDSAGSNAGAVYLLKKINNQWTIINTFLPPVSNSSETNYGNAIAIRNNTILIGQEKANSSNGNIYLAQKINGEFKITRKLNSLSSAPNRRLGTSVALNDTFVFAGVVYSNYSGGVTYIHYKPSEVPTFTILPPETENDSLKFYFGISVNAYEDFAIVGAPGDYLYDTIDYSGCAYIYHFENNKWNLFQKLQPSDTVDKSFGTEVKIYKNYALVAAPSEDKNGPFSGIVYIFKQDGTGYWNFYKELQGSDTDTSDEFGLAMDITDNFAVIGAPYNKAVNDINCGAAYVFRYNDSSWTQVQKLVPSYNPWYYDQFGSSVSISNKYITVGVPNANDHMGRTYGYKYTGTQWNYFVMFNSPYTSTNYSYFGGSVSNTDDYMIISSDVNAKFYQNHNDFNWSNIQLINDEYSTDYYNDEKVCLNDKFALSSLPRMTAINYYTIKEGVPVFTKWLIPGESDYGFASDIEIWHNKIFVGASYRPYDQMPVGKVYVYGPKSPQITSGVSGSNENVCFGSEIQLAIPDTFYSYQWQMDSVNIYTFKKIYDDSIHFFGCQSHLLTVTADTFTNNHVFRCLVKTDSANFEFPSTTFTFNIDTVLPEITCPGNFIVEPDSNHYYQIQGAEFDPIDVYDNCEIKSVSNNYNNLWTLSSDSLYEGEHTIEWTVTDIAGNKNTCSIHISVKKYPGLIIFPNPANDNLHVHYSDIPVYRITLMNSIGQVIDIPQTVMQKETVLNTENIESGIYFLKIEIRETSTPVIKKFVKL